MSKEIAQFKHQITKATLGDGTVLGATTIKIFAPDNKLGDGYYVYIENIDDNRVPDGVYYVNNVTENNFDIFIFEHPWNFPALGITVLDLDLNSCWHKIPSKKHETYKNCTISTHFGDNQANINLQGFPMCLDRSSIVFIDNIGYRISQSETVVKVPNGYYSVRSVSFGGQKLVVDLSEMSTMMRSDMVYPQGVNDVISVTKIGQDDQGIFSRINNDVMVTIIFSPSLPLPGGFVYKNIVRLFDYNHDCKIGDYAVFQGLPKDGLNVDGIIVQNNSRYKIFELGKYYTDLLAEDDPWQVDCLIIGYLKERLKITATSIYTDIVHIIIDFYYTLIEGTSITGDGVTGMIKLSNIPDLSNFHVQYISYTDNNPIIIPKIIEGFKHTITKVTFGDGTIKGKWTFNIYAPNNGLQNGNYVYIKNDSQFNYAIPSNVYYVYNTSKGNFSIFLISNDYTIRGSVYPGTWEFDLKGEGCWHKIPAREYETIERAIISGHMGAQQLTIDSQEYLNWQPKNVVFISGIGYRRIEDNIQITVKVCDGYYNVENIAGFGRINISLTVSPEYSSARSIFPQDSNTSITITKIGFTDFGIMNDNIGLAFDSEVITSGKDSGQWRLYAKDNKYKIGDNIVLHGFGENCQINDVLIYNNVFYTIMEIANNYIEIVFNDLLLSGYCVKALNNKEIIIPIDAIEIIKKYYLGEFDAITISEGGRVESCCNCKAIKLSDIPDLSKLYVEHINHENMTTAGNIDDVDVSSLL